MSVFMRAVLREWPDPPFASLSAFVAEQGSFSVVSVGDRGWREFEVVDREPVLAGDLSTGPDARAELEELAEALDDHEGADASRDAVSTHLAQASAIVGLRVFMSAYDRSVDAANEVIAFLEQVGAVLTQVDTVGWYNGPELLLREPD